MKEVIRIQDDKVQDEKPVEFTHCLLGEYGWLKTRLNPSSSEFQKIVYLGKCTIYGDMFAAHSRGNINIFKGRLNSGKY